MISRLILATPVLFFSSAAIASERSHAPIELDRVEQLSGSAHRYIVPVVIAAIIAAIVYATLDDSSDETPTSA